MVKVSPFKLLSFPWINRIVIGKGNCFIPRQSFERQCVANIDGGNSPTMELVGSLPPLSPLASAVLMGLAFG